MKIQIASQSKAASRQGVTAAAALAAVAESFPADELPRMFAAWDDDATDDFLDGIHRSLQTFCAALGWGVYLLDPDTAELFAI